MANFKTHLTVAATISVSAALGLCISGFTSITAAIGLSFLGIMGGLAPDMDSDHSTSIRVIFTVVAILCSLALGWQLYSVVSTELLAINMGAVFVAIRLGIKRLFMEYSVHRGCCHSIVFALLIGLGAVVILHGFKLTANLCWLGGGFLFAGCMLHLALDELYSIDIHGKRIKSSFGTALKLMSFKNPYISTVQLIVIGYFYYHAPKLHMLALEKIIHLHSGTGV